MSLRLSSVRSGKLMDTIALVDGVLKYDSGVAQGIFENIRTTRKQSKGIDTTDTELYRALAGWSNGYLTIKEKS